MSYLKKNLTEIVTLMITVSLLVVSFTPTGSGYEFPKTVSIIMVSISVILVLMTMIQKKEVATDNGDPIRWGSIWPTLFVLISLLLVVEWLGFFVTCFIAFYLIVMIYSPERLCLRSVVKSGVISVIFIGVLYLIFVSLLNVQIPSGILI